MKKLPAVRVGCDRACLCSANFSVRLVIGDLNRSPPLGQPRIVALVVTFHLEHPATIWVKMGFHHRANEKPLTGRIYIPIPFSFNCSSAFWIKTGFSKIFDHRHRIPDFPHRTTHNLSGSSTAAVELRFLNVPYPIATGVMVNNQLTLLVAILKVGSLNQCAFVPATHIL